MNSRIPIRNAYWFTHRRMPALAIALVAVIVGCKGCPDGPTVPHEPTDHDGFPPRCQRGSGDAYADAVVAWVPGTGTPAGVPADALGAPDVVPPSTAGLFALGVGGRLTVAFTDNAAIDRRGVDLVVYEVTFGSATEPEGATFEVAECEGDRFVPITPRRVGGDDVFTIELDLADAGLRSAELLRITDDGDTSFGGNGFDVDAVEALHSCATPLCRRPTPTPTPRRACTVGDGHADEVIAVRPGAGPTRGVPADALGAPDTVPPDPFGLYALGVAGSITLGLDEAIVDGPGIDLLVYEGTFGTAAVAEGAAFFLAECEDAPFVPVAPVRVTGDQIFAFHFDLADAGLASAVRLRIVDDGDRGQGGNGFDIDAITAIHCALDPCRLPTPTPTPIGDDDDDDN